MGDLDARLRALSPQKRALFEKLLAERRAQLRAATQPDSPAGVADAAAPATVASPAGAGDGVHPISVMQQGLWFLEQVRPHNPAYVIPAAVRIRGRLDLPVLRRAIAAIVARHAVLRTTFTVRDGAPVQVVAPHGTVELAETDLRGSCLLGDGRDDGDGPGPDELGLRERIHTIAYRPFDLEHGPLLRVALLHLGDDDAVLVLAMHHLISDGWSVGILLRELSAAYQAFLDGRADPSPALRIQYGDDAARQQRALADGSLDAGLEHWRAHLAGAPAALDLPTDRPRPAVQGFDGAAVPLRLPRPLAQALRGLGRAHRATPYMVLLALLDLLLARWSGSRDVVVGVPCANRSRADVEPLIGFFVNTVPVRTRLDGDPTFAEVLRRVREGCLAAYAHDGVPLERIVADAKAARDLSRAPLFQVALSHQPDPFGGLRMGEARLTRVSLPTRGARFDLELQLFDDPDGIGGWVEYDRDLFDEATITRFAGQLVRLARQVVSHPDAPAERLDLLDDAERAAVLAAGTGPHRDWPGTGWLHTAFEQQARQRPDAEALRFEGSALSYGELNRRANRLAHRLRGLGAGPGAVVGVCQERSLELVISLLAVLKAGAAYLPLDPGYPAERLAFLLDDAAVEIVLTQSRLRDRLPDRVGVRASAAEPIAVDDLDLTGADTAFPDTDPGVDVDGEDLAYVIYTSGSTGRPKGVMNVHAAIRSRLLWMQDTFGLQPGERVLQKTPFSFDVSVWEFFWPLMVGATLVVARPGGHQDPAYLVDVIDRERVSTLHFVPSMLQLFLAEPGVEGLTGLRRVICSGEALPQPLQERFHARSAAELHNLYGPTEAAVDVTWWACRRDGDPRPVPIGYPIANTTMLVLDRHLQLVPPGVPGELHIGGRNLARGYLRRPQLTAERFVPHPFPGAPGERLYRTGDLARVRDDGAIEYLGRLDHQVKLRGQRIELGEIESVLAEHEQVREAVVVARQFGPGDVRLVGYLTAAGDGRPPQSGELLTYLRGRLPEHLVPGILVPLEALPLSPNGKVDRAALPQPDAARPELATPYRAPATELEGRIAAVWQEVLGVPRVGTDDTFFDLGGHSLLLAQLRTRLVSELGLADADRDLSLVELFQYPTVGALAEHLQRSGDGAAGTDGTVADGRRRAADRIQSADHRRQAAARRTRARNGR